MSLEIVMGPMFAGKSSYLLSTVRRYQAIDYPVLCITSHLDTRYADVSAIHSHDHERIPAMPVKQLREVDYLLSYMDAKLLIIEEAQFYPDLFEFVLHAVERDGKDVIVCGLDGDADRLPMGQILNLIPLADKVTKLTALCQDCGNLTPAIFTYRKDETAPSQIGGAEQYESLCRTHYIRKRFGDSLCI
jgi:thymidine kinase